MFPDVHSSHFRTHRDRRDRRLCDGVAAVRARHAGPAADSAGTLRRAAATTREFAGISAVVSARLRRRLRNRPRSTAHLVGIARPGDAVLSAVVSWVGERINVFPEFPYADTVNPAYATLDLAASWEARKGIAPYVRLLNALDREYEAVLGFPASGRTLIGGVRLEW